MGKFKFTPLTFMIAVFTVVVLIGISLFLLKVNMRSPVWPVFHYNAQRTGQCLYSTSNNNGKLKWKIQLDGGRGTISSPVIGADGTIYIGTSKHLYAVNPNGKIR